MGIDLSKIVKEIQKEGFSGAIIGDTYHNAELVPFKNAALNLITEGGLPYGHIHEFFGLNATGKCVGGESLVTTEDGLIPIEDLFAPLVDKAQVRTIPVHTLLEPDRWYRLKKPIKVLAPSGGFEEMSRLYYGGKQPVLVLYTKNNYHITGTLEHKIQVVTPRDKTRKYLSLEELRKSKDNYLVPLRIGARIYGNNTELLAYGAGKFPKVLTPELAFDLGRLAVSISISNYYGPKVLKHKKAMVDAIEKRWGGDFYSRNPEFIKWLLLNEIVISSLDTVEVPFVVKTAPREIVTSYILGILSTAKVTRKGLLELRHKSYHLITQLQAFLLNEGIMSEVKFDTRHSMQVLRLSPSYLPVLKECPAVACLDEGSFKELINNNSYTYPVDDIIYEPIRRVWKSRVELPVFDGEMPDTHAYIANGFLSHNSYFMYELIAQSQKIYDPTIGIIIDREGAYNPVRGAQLGVDNSQLIVSKPYDTVMPKDAVAFIEKNITAIRKHYKDAHIFVALDSLAAFDKDINMDSQDMGKGAKAWHAAFRRLLNLIDEKTIMIYSNHVTYKPTAYGDGKTKAGGEAGNYYRSCGIALTKKAHIRDPRLGNEVIGDSIQVVVDKTRHGPAFREVVLPIYYKDGCPVYGGYLWLLASRGYVKPKNKEDYKKGLAKSYIYTKDDIKFTLVEGREEHLLEKFPELRFGVYPDYNANASQESEDEEDS